MSDVPDSSVSVREQLHEVVCALVDDQDAVEILEEDLGNTRLLQVRVADDELGKVIGRQGRTVRALRALLEVRGSESDVYYDLEVLEEDD